MFPDFVLNVYKESPSNTDTLAIVYPDSVWIANIPEQSIVDSLGMWLVPLGSILLTAFITYWWTRRIYEDQKKNAQKEKDATAFRLYWAVCDEMFRTRTRVWNIIEHANNYEQLRGPILTDAKDTLLGRLTELMPASWESHHVFRYYELLSLVALPFNDAAGTPVVTTFEAMRAMGLSKLKRPGVDENVATDYRKRHSGFTGGLSFAMHYYDTENGDNLTDHYIAAYKQLTDLGKNIGVDSVPDFSLPSDAEREKQRHTISMLFRDDIGPSRIGS